MNVNRDCHLSKRIMSTITITMRPDMLWIMVHVSCKLHVKFGAALVLFHHVNCAELLIGSRSSGPEHRFVLSRD